MASGAAVEQHVLDRVSQRVRNVLVDRELAGIDDTHVHAGAGRVIEERRVHRLADGVVAAERERDVGDPARDVNLRPPGLDLAGGLDEGAGVVVVLLDAGGDGEDVGVEDDVGGSEAHTLGEQAIGALADRELALGRLGLPLFVEGHDHHGRAIAPHQPGLFEERRLALLEADGVDHRLAGDRPQARLDGGPVGGVDHHRHPRDVGLGRDQVEEAGHGGLAVQHPLVHVDVDDLGAVLDLLARHLERRRVVAGGDQLAEPGRARDVGALAHVDEGAAVLAALEGLEPGEAELGRARANGARRMARDGVRDGRDVRGRGAAAAPHQVDQAGLGPLAQLRGGLVRRLVVAAELVGEPGIGVGADARLGDPRQIGEVRAHVGRPEGAVEPDAEGRGVGERQPERLHRLAVEHAARAVGDRARDEDRQPRAAGLEHLVQRHQGRLGVERIEDRLQQDEVDPAFDQGLGRLAVGGAEGGEVDGALARVVHVGETERVLFVGPSTPATKRGRSAVAAASAASRAIRALARLSARTAPPRP